MNPGINVDARDIAVGGHILGPVNSYNTVHYNSDSQRVTLANWVSKLDFSQDQAQAFQKYTEGTLLWLLEEPRFIDWLRNGGMLWLTGKPGVGKTVLASFIIDHLQRLETKPAVCYIYCRYDSTRTTLQVFEAILRQIILRCPTASVERVQKAKDHSHRLTLKDILSILQQTFDPVQNIFIVVDALDECFDEDTRHQVFRHLQSLSRIPILITSRPLPTTIESSTSKAAKLIISAHKEDVQTHFRAQQETNPTLAKLASNVPDAEEKVMAKADGSFLLAQLHMKHLADQTNIAHLRHALDTLPDEAATIYESSLGRIQKQSPAKQRLAFHTLSWILYAMRTLELIELRHALAIENLNRMATDDELDDEEVIISSCAGLIEFNEWTQTVTFIHYTVQEFLRTALLAKDLLSEVTVATTCLRVISFPGIESDPPNYPLIIYAVSFWGDLVSKYEHEDMVLNLAVSQLAEGATEIVAQSRLTRCSGYPVALYWPENPSTLDLLALYGLVRTCTVLIEKHQQTVFPLVVDGRNALSLATRCGHFDFVKLLLDTLRVNINIKTKYGATALACAAQHGHLDIVKLLLSHPNIDVNSKSRGGQTPLGLAAELGDLEIVKLLLSHPHIDVNTKGRQTPLGYAAQKDRLETVELFLPLLNIDVNTKGRQTLLGYAAEKERLEIVKLLLSHPNIDVNAEGEYDQTSLGYAAEIGWLEAVKLLLSQPNINVNLADRWTTPLGHAARNGHLEIVKLLLGHPNIDVNAKGQRNQIPLSYAAKNGRLEVVKLLLSHANIDVNPKDRRDRTPLGHAAEKGHLKIVKLLLSHSNIDVNPKDQYLVTRLSMR